MFLAPYGSGRQMNLSTDDTLGGGVKGKLTIGRYGGCMRLDKDAQKCDFWPRNYQLLKEVALDRQS